jgi:hypothetical protein
MVPAPVLARFLLYSAGVWVRRRNMSNGRMPYHKYENDCAAVRWRIPGWPSGWCGTEQDREKESSPNGERGTTTETHIT